jgi:hypothetical protein
MQMHVFCPWWKETSACTPAQTTNASIHVFLCVRLLVQDPTAGGHQGMQRRRDSKHAERVRKKKCGTEAKSHTLCTGPEDVTETTC